MERHSIHIPMIGANSLNSAKGVLTVLTKDGHFTAPPAMAVWLPPGITHEIRPVGAAKFRSLYIAKNKMEGMPLSCVVLSVDSLLRNLILEAANLPREYTLGSGLEYLMREFQDTRPDPLYSNAKSLEIA